jgi:hypothetical protein
MTSCSELLNTTTIVGTRETWGSVDRSALKDFTVTSYLRPDTGAALLPWVYTIVAIVIHVPVVIVRATRWDIVQNWCLVSTFLIIMVYVLAYISTNFAADQILVWTPLVLIIDAGSMLQIFFLVLETESLRINGSIFLFERPGGVGLLGRLRRKISWADRGSSSDPAPPNPGTGRPADEDHQMNEIAPNPPEAQNINNENHSPENEEMNNDNQEQIPNEPADQLAPLIEGQQVQEEANINNGNRDPAANRADDRQNLLHAELVKGWENPAPYIAIASLFLFLAIIVLQILGLHAAFRARKGGQTPLVSWCSPVFQPFGVATVDGDCHIYKINQSTTRGIGCIRIPGVWQRRWLTGTIVGIILSLIFEIVDFIILSYFGVNDKRGCIKWQRPWATMIGGLVILGITLVYGLEYASGLPPGITEHVTIAINVNGTKAFNAKLTNSGLRGTIIGWNDGLFDSWKEKYTGSMVY